MINELIIGLVCAVVGAYIPIFHSIIRIRKHKGLNGYWYSYYHDLEIEPNSLVKERVKIVVKKGKVHLISLADRDEIKYLAELDIHQEIYLSGTWRNIKNKRETGVMTLIVSNNLKFCYGFWTQVGNDQKTSYGGWILCRSEKDYTQAKYHLTAAMESIRKKYDM